MLPRINAVLFAVLLGLFGWATTSNSASISDLVYLPYSKSGFHGNATNTTVKFWISCSGPTSLCIWNNAFVDMAAGVRTAHFNWSAGVRPWVGLTIESSTSTVGGIPVPYWWQEGGGGTNIWRINGSGQCVSPQETMPWAHCWSQTYPNSSDPFPETKYVGSVAHEIGHGLFSLKDIFAYDCSTIMSACWDVTPHPTNTDEKAARTVIGVPDSIVAQTASPTVVWICWFDRSYYEDRFEIGAFKMVGGQWVPQYTIIRPPIPLAGGETCHAEDPPSAGTWIYSVSARNIYLNGVVATQLGNFTQSVVVQ